LVGFRAAPVQASSQGGEDGCVDGSKVIGVAYEGYDLLRIDVRGGVLRATIDNPPVNLLDLR